jgi:two-component system NtrC family response regulator/two-component system response regulator AtoC
MARILLVDDDVTFRKVMASELDRRGYQVSAAGSGRAALETAKQVDPEVVLLDMKLPDMHGIDVLKELREHQPGAGVILLTGHGTIDTAIQAIRLGAYDYLEKPCPIESLELAVQKACEHVRLVKRQRVLEDGYVLPGGSPGLIGESPAFKKLLEEAARIAATEETTLILGETGGGKELIAKLLHSGSPRREAPFVVVDCAALHENLLQSEVFGHEKGSFTGAVRRKHGLFEVADGGTVFLDEIGDTGLDIQAKLLRVLETGRFRRLGGTEEIAVDVRLIAATNRNLQKAMARGHFREDLFFRLSTFTIKVPPLRDRQDDIRLLVDHFTRQFNQRFSLTRSMSPEAMEVLRLYSWPGNVRELIHVVEQTVVLSRQDEILVADLPAALRTRPAAPEPAPSEKLLPLREIERRHILFVLDQVGENRSKAARILDISERNLYRRLKKYIQPDTDLKSDGAAGGDSGGA